KFNDVVAHILDVQLRALSIQRDSYFGENPPASNQYDDLVAWLNQLNSDWVSATKRLSPQVLILLLESIGDLVADYYDTLDPWQEAIFSVAWAGESTSYNWMHLAREYTEYWHHQQQVREATSHKGILNQQFFFPVIDTFFQALPYTFKDVKAKEGTTIEVHITSDAGGTWFLVRDKDEWKLQSQAPSIVTAYVSIPVAISWVLFSKSLRPDQVKDQVIIKGDQSLAEKVLEMVSVIA
ncbi:MAG: hypothetical protein AAFQ94_15225, partial [Bacteroidota bacterium]